MVRKRVVAPDMQLENVELKRQKVADLFGSFSFQHLIPVGLEVAHGGEEPTLFELELTRGTLSELLRQFVADHPEYTWKIENGVLNVFPKDDYRDPLLRQLLATEVESFSVAKRTSAWNFGQNLLRTSEAKRLLDSYRVTYDTGYLGGFYIQQLGREYSFDVSHTSFKSILDKLVRESPTTRYWLLSHDLVERRLFLRVNAIAEVWNDK
ncbi:MAG TPA: hypothetical protein VFS76_13940 [Pyrinomonadaceae bacterium]|nr:hypothetical protein [Pyrinomonadaceae bacterium]